MGPNHLLKVKINMQLIISAMGANENIFSKKIKSNKKDFKI